MFQNLHHFLLGTLKDVPDDWEYNYETDSYIVEMSQLAALLGLSYEIPHLQYSMSSSFPIG